MFDAGFPLREACHLQIADPRRVRNSPANAPPTADNTSRQADTNAPQNNK
jgi:hypothetical protein